MPSTTSVLSSVAAVAGLGYLVWFDYQRRHSTSFRKQLRAKTRDFETSKSKEVRATEERQRAILTSFIEKSLAEDSIPNGLEAREKFFIGEIGKADQLLAQGPAGQVAAALAFYRALCAYPQPLDLLSMYEKSIPAPVLLQLRLMIDVCPPPALASILKAETSAESVE